MNVQDIGAAPRGMEHAEERVHERLKAFHTRRPQSAEPNSLPLLVGVLADIGAAHDRFDTAAEMAQLARQILDMPLDAALHIREAAQPEHGDAQAGERIGRNLP